MNGRAWDQNVPRELQATPQWVLWREESRRGKRTKVPYQCTGERAAVNRAQTWSTFGEAVAAYDRGGYEGIGFVFAESDCFAGIDLDGCRDLESGEMEPWAAEIVSRFGKTYGEVSPSGTGVHVLAAGKLPAGAWHKVSVKGAVAKGGKRPAIEVYDRRRWFAVTGDILNGAEPVLHEAQEAVEWLIARFRKTPPAAPRAPALESFASAGDDDIIAMARRAANGAKFERLWSGAWEGEYGSQSEADSALCCLLAFYTRDPDQLDRLIRRSDLYRDKWDERRGESTYGATTIAHAREVVSASYSALVPTAPSRSTGEAGTVAALDFPATDSGNAELFAALYGDRLRYDHAQGRWLVWHGHRWAQDDDGEVVRLAKAAARERYRAAERIDNLEERRRVSRWAIASESRNRIDACLTLARAETPITDDGKGWDADAWLLGVANGVVDLRTAELRDGRREDRMTMALPIAYDPAAVCPGWQRFVFEVLGDEETVGFVRRAIGYSLTGNTREQVLFLLHGRGSNGKSVFLNVIRRLAGEFGHNLPFTVIEQGDRNAGTFDLAGLVGKRLATSSETNEASRLNTARVKALTGGDPVSAAFKHRDYFTFRPVAHYWLAVNHLPQVDDDSDGFWRRVRLIPFLRQFIGADIDSDLGEKLIAELPGILAWALQGALEWQAEGLRPPDAVMMASWRYREDSDPLGQFLVECAVIHPGAVCLPADAYREYTGWAERQGLGAAERLSSNRFGRRMRERFDGPREAGTGRRPYHGVELRSKASVVGA